MYNLEEYENQYGEMFVRQLEIEEGYKQLAAEATSKTYENVENSTMQDDVASQTKAGQKFIAAQWKHVNEAMTLFVDSCLQPKKGSKASYVLLVQEIEKVCGKENMVNLFTLTTFTTLLNGVLKKKTSRSTFAKNISDELYYEISLQAFLSQSDFAEVIKEGIKKRVGISYKRAYVRACMEQGQYAYHEWDKEQRLTLATSLMEVVLAASNYFETTSVNGLTEIIPSQFLIEQWQAKTQWLIDNSYKFCPCVIPPREWQSVTEGGYYGELANQTKLLRLRDNRDVFAKHYFAKLAQLELTDVRKAVNAVELLSRAAKPVDGKLLLTREDALQVAQHSAMRYDREGDDHYDLLSALQKSIRGSDPDAAVYYLGRLLVAGDLLSPCRRLLVIASEDIGLAYPQAMAITKACVDAAVQLGLPEARLPLAEAAVLLATAPKSNSSHNAIIAAMQDIEKGRVGDIPRHLKNVHADSAGSERPQAYKYPHVYPKHYVRQRYLPESLGDTTYYEYADNKTEQAAKHYWDLIKGGGE